MFWIVLDILGLLRNVLDCLGIFDEALSVPSLDQSTTLPESDWHHALEHMAAWRSYCSSWTGATSAKKCPQSATVPEIAKNILYIPIHIYTSLYIQNLPKTTWIISTEKHPRNSQDTPGIPRHFQIISKVFGFVQSISVILCASLCFFGRQPLLGLLGFILSFW